MVEKLINIYRAARAGASLPNNERVVFCYLKVRRKCRFTDMITFSDLIRVQFILPIAIFTADSMPGGRNAFLLVCYNSSAQMSKSCRIRGGLAKILLSPWVPSSCMVVVECCYYGKVPSSRMIDRELSFQNVPFSRNTPPLLAPWQLLQPHLK